MLAFAIADMALAVAGLAVGVLHVSRGVEVGTFGVAVGTAGVAMWRLLTRLLDDDLGAPTGWLPAATSSRRQRLARERSAAKRTRILLAGSLAAGAAVAVMRSGGGEVVRPLPHWLIIALERLSRSSGSGIVFVQQGGDGHGILAAVLAAAGVVLAFIVAALLASAGRPRIAVAAAGSGTLGLAAALTFSLGHPELHPQFDLAPTLRIERPTLLSLQTGPSQTGGPVEHEPLTLLSLGGLRIWLHVGGTAPCGCRRTLPYTP